MKYQVGDEVELSSDYSKTVTDTEFVNFQNQYELDGGEAYLYEKFMGVLVQGPTLDEAYRMNDDYDDAASATNVDIEQWNQHTVYGGGITISPEKMANILNNDDDLPPKHFQCKRTNRGVIDFANLILHGDDEHKCWILEAANAYVSGCELPLVRGTNKVTEPWSGKGLPPVGVKCVYREKGKDQEVEAVYSSEWLAVIRCTEGENKGVEIPITDSSRLRVLKTPEEKEREEFVKDAMNYGHDCHFSHEQWMENLFTAGYRKPE